MHEITCTVTAQNNWLWLAPLMFGMGYVISSLVVILIFNWPIKQEGKDNG